MDLFEEKYLDSFWPMGPNGDDFAFSQPLLGTIAKCEKIESGITALSFDKRYINIPNVSRSLAQILNLEMRDGVNIPADDQFAFEIDDIELSKDGKSLSSFHELLTSDIIEKIWSINPKFNLGVTLMFVAQISEGQIVRKIPVALITADQTPSLMLRSWSASYLFGGIGSYLNQEIIDILKSDEDFVLTQNETELIRLFRKNFSPTMNVGDLFTLEPNDMVRAKELFLEAKDMTSGLRITSLCEGKLQDAVLNTLFSHVSYGLPRLTFFKDRNGNYLPNPINEQGIFQPSREFFISNSNLQTLFSETLNILEALEQGYNTLEDGVFINQRIDEIRKKLSPFCGIRKDDFFLLCDHMNPAFILDWCLKSMLVLSINQIHPRADIAAEGEVKDIDIEIKNTDILPDEQKWAIANKEGLILIKRYLGVPHVE